MPDPVRVLYVDDKEMASRTAASLERGDEQFTVERAPGVTAALESLSETIDCIVANQRLPDGSGMQLLKHVRTEHPELPFVLLCEPDDEAVADEAIAAGASDVYRPCGDVSSVLLCNRIKNLVEGYRAGAAADSRGPRRDRYRRQLLEIMADAETTAAEKTQQLLELGRERLGTDSGHLVKIDRENERHEVVSVIGSGIISEGVSDLSTTYCRRTIESPNVLDVHNVPEAGWEDDSAYREFGLGCYIGQKVLVADELYGTVCFASERPRETAFDRGETEFVGVLAQCFARLLEKRRRRKQAETVFDHTQDALFLVDVTRTDEFRIRRVNSVYEELTGVSATELRGKTLREVVGDEWEVVLEEHYRNCVEQAEPIEYEERLQVDSQDRIWQTKLAPVVEDGDVVQLVGATRDITDQKEREKQLKSRTRAMEKAPVGITISDPNREDNPLSYVNEYFVEQTGYSKDEALGRNCRFLQGERTDPEPIETMRAAVASGEPTSVELRNYRKDGTEFWNRVDIAPLFDEDGSLIDFVGYQQEVTEEVEYKRQLERQNERLDEFVSLVSHDLRNPLTVAKVRLDLVREECDSKHLEALETAHERMEELVENLLPLVRQGKQVVEPERISLGRLAEETWNHVVTGDATLVVDTDRYVEADSARLTRLLENLLRNAIEHGGDVSTVTVGDLDDGFYVADDGDGVPEADREQIFEDGYTTSSEGTGLGLSIVAEIVDDHDWAMAVTESADGGARFEIRTGETSD